ncbi:hypothetical protein ZWY2020_042684 [Hordeum vulgare]|nr:hypothetical protein ZWY2020_042684 [Hordeum vulgare]
MRGGQVKAAARVGGGAVDQVREATGAGGGGGGGGCGGGFASLEGNLDYNASDRAENTSAVTNSPPGHPVHIRRKTASGTNTV